MLDLIARRVLAMIPILLGVVVVAALLVELMPGDPAAIIAGADATPEAVEMIRRDLGLDTSWWERVGGRVGALVQGDLGRSPGSGFAVRDRIAAALPVTMSIGLMTLVIGVPLGVAAGTVAALRRGRLADRVVMAVAAVLLAVPTFVVALALVLLFAVNRRWLPAVGYVPLTEDPLGWLRHVIMPAAALATTVVAELARQTRSALVDTLEQDFIRASRAKGLAERWVIGKHASKNAATPVVTVLGLQAGRILGLTVVVELIFGMNGFGRLALTAVLSRDPLLIQGVVLVSAIVVLLANLVVDVTYGYLNPRTRT